MDYKDFMAGYTKNFFWFKAKNELIKILVLKACGGKKRLRILNIGVGVGDELEILNEFGSNYVVDKDPNALSAIDGRFCKEKKLADACDLPYEDDFFDVVVSFDVFEHIADDARSAGEIRRVLKKHGALVFTVPAFSFIMSSHDKALHHLRRYDKKRLDDLLRQFEKRNFYYWNSLLFIPVAIVRILKRGSKGKIDKIYLFSWINDFFYDLLAIDNFLIKRGRSFPVGLTIAGFCYK